MTDTADDATSMQRSSRDPEQLRADLERWLAQRVGEGATPSVTSLAATSANGMSSETVLLTARWREGDGDVDHELVARLAPDPADVPVFPRYDLSRQFRVIAAVAELTSVPVPTLWWDEPDASHIGSPFFVMSRVEGEVPPDVMPYNFGDSWLFRSTEEEQRRLQDSTVAVLAELHAIEAAEQQLGFLQLDAPGATPLRRLVADTAAWYDFACEGHRSELIERGFAWLERHWPADEGPTALAWGDARIGNVMYRHHRPVAVLDWEMAALGPRELDLAWMLYAHRVFEDIAHAMGLPGMPGFLRPDDVAAEYEARTGHTPRHLGFHEVYAALRYAIVFLRTGLRSVHFGERPAPDHVDELLHNRERLEQLLSGPPA